MNEMLDRQTDYTLRREGRFLVAELQAPHQVLSTSACSGGMTGEVRFLVNHQSCEGQGHLYRFEWMTALGETGYHRHVCEELGLAPESVAVMGTAANMKLRLPYRRYFRGTPRMRRRHRRGRGQRRLRGRSRGLAFNGIRADGKTPARRHDQHDAPRQLAANARRHGAGGRHHDGGQVGRAVRRATLEALRWQNGLEASSTRSVYHALKRYGLKAEPVLAAPLLRQQAAILASSMAAKPKAWPACIPH